MCFSGYFRKPFPDKDPLVSKIYGEAAPFLFNGLSGHAIGKSFYRTGHGLSLGLHQPLPSDVWWQPDNPARRWTHRTALLHFDSISQTHWINKMAIRLRADGQMAVGRNPGRMKQMKVITGFDDSDMQAERLYSLVRQVTPRQFAQLVFHRKLLPYHFDIAPALKAIWPGVTVDLTPGGIDRDLARTQMATKKPGAMTPGSVQKSESV